jgi:hypothetical protein
LSWRQLGSFPGFQIGEDLRGDPRSRVGRIAAIGMNCDASALSLMLCRQ